MKKLILLNCFILAVTSNYAQVADTINVYFAFNKSNIGNNAIRQIDELLATYSNQFTIRSVQITGHCDSKGNNGYNDSLSLQRALAVKKHLHLKNISESLITTTNGLGKKLAFVNANTDKARALNRRVEVVIIKDELVKDNSAAVATTETPFIKQVALIETPFPKNEEIAVPQKPSLIIREEKATTVSAADTSANVSEQLISSQLAVGSNFVLKNLNFVGGKSTLLLNSFPVLKELLKVLKENPSLVIEIQGHVCCDSDSPEGYELSVLRAKAVYSYLTKNGILKNRLSYTGFGSKKKIIEPEITEEDKIQNRRVEIKILKKETIQ